MTTIYKQYDTVFLNDGRAGVIIEVLGSNPDVGLWYELEIPTPGCDRPYELAVVDCGLISGLVPEGYELPNPYE